MAKFNSAVDEKNAILADLKSIERRIELVKADVDSYVEDDANRAYRLLCTAESAVEEARALFMNVQVIESDGSVKT